jgi:hypothetical protein
MSYPLAADRTQNQLQAREKFIAMRLIENGPEGYQAILEEENKRRAEITLKADIAEPKAASKLSRLFKSANDGGIVVPAPAEAPAEPQPQQRAAPSAVQSFFDGPALY